MESQVLNGCYRSPMWTNNTGLFCFRHVLCVKVNENICVITRPVIKNCLYYKLPHHCNTFNAFKYISWKSRGGPKDSWQQDWNLYMAFALSPMKLWRVAASPRRTQAAYSHASKCCGTNSISSRTRVLLLTAAGQNNAYLFMHTSRKHMWVTEVYTFLEKKDKAKQKKTAIKGGTVTLGFWVACDRLQ